MGNRVLASSGICTTAFALVIGVGWLPSVGAQAPQGNLAPAEELHLHVRTHSESFRKLEQPVSVEYLLAGIDAAQRKLKSGHCVVESRWERHGAVADASDREYGVPFRTRAKGELEHSYMRCRWVKSGPKFAYFVEAMEGNRDVTATTSRMAAAYDGVKYRMVEVHRDGSVNASVASEPAAFIPFYELDPNRFGRVVYGHVDNLHREFSVIRANGGKVAVVGTETVHGAECYRVEADMSSGGRWVFWFDKAHDLLVRREEEVSGDADSDVIVTDVPTLCQSGGVWMPEDAALACYFHIPVDKIPAPVRNNNLFARILRDAQHITGFVANKPVPDSIFVLTFPPGAVVQDTDKGTIWTVPQVKTPKSPSKKRSETPGTRGPGAAAALGVVALLAAAGMGLATYRGRDRGKRWR